MSDNYKKTKSQKIKEAKKTMTKDQLKKCHTIIHTAAAASAAAGAIPIPIADAIPISAAQTSMVLALGKVFDYKLLDSTARGLLSSVASSFIGRSIVKFIPIIGWGVSAAVAAGITEAIGWSIAVDFSTGSFDAGYKTGCNETSKVYEAKFTKQAEDFAKQKEKWERAEQLKKLSDKELRELLNDCLKYIADLEKELHDLTAKNQPLSKEKQDLLNELYGIRYKLIA